MASKPPADCCTAGVKHDGQPTGLMTKIGDIDAYIAEPAGGTSHREAALLLLPDVLSIWQNSKLIADQFAANGYYTVIIDLFNGDAKPLNAPPGFDFMSWMTKGSTGDNPHTIPAVEPVVEAGLEYLRQEKGFKKIGAIGYCFGAKYVIRYLKEQRGIDVGYCGHPAFVEEAELAAIAGPLCIAAAETDAIFSAEKRHRSEEILKATKQPYQISLFSGVEHGFAIRCDMSMKMAKFAKEQAFLQAVNWFNEWL